VSGLSQSLGIDRSAETKSDTRAEELAVGQSSDTLVVDFGLYKGVGVKLVFAGNLQANAARVAALSIPGCLCASLNLSIHAVVIRGSKDVQVVRGRNGSSVLGNAVANSCGVFGNLPAFDIIAYLSARKKSVMANDGIAIEGGTFQHIEERTGVEERLTKMEVQLGTRALTGGGEKLGDDLGLQTVGDGVIKLNLGVQSIESRPRLG